MQYPHHTLSGYLTTLVTPEFSAPSARAEMKGPIPNKAKALVAVDLVDRDAKSRHPIIIRPTEVMVWSLEEGEGFGLSDRHSVAINCGLMDKCR